MVTDGVDGLLVPCGDAPALASALVRLRDDNELRSRLARAGRVRAPAFAANVSTPRLHAWLVALRAGRVGRGTISTTSD